MPPDRLGRRRKRPSGGDAPRYPPRRAADVAAPPASQQPRPGMPPLPHPLPQWRLQSRCSSAGDHAAGPWIAPPKRAAVCEKEPLTTISRQPQKTPDARLGPKHASHRVPGAGSTYRRATWLSPLRFPDQWRCKQCDRAIEFFRIRGSDNAHATRTSCRGRNSLTCREFLDGESEDRL
jgi:hypothetical protein